MEQPGGKRSIPFNFISFSHINSDTLLLDITTWEREERERDYVEKEREREREVESNLSFHFGIISSMIVTRDRREKKSEGERERGTTK